MKIGFIGLGNVGGKLAGSLLRNKFNLTVIDLDDNLVKDFVSKGAATAKSPKELTEKVDLLYADLIELNRDGMWRTRFASWWTGERLLLFGSWAERDTGEIIQGDPSPLLALTAPPQAG